MYPYITATHVYFQISTQYTELSREDTYLEKLHSFCDANMDVPSGWSFTTLDFGSLACDDDSCQFLLRHIWTDGWPPQSQKFLRRRRAQVKVTLLFSDHIFSKRFI